MSSDVSTEKRNLRPFTRRGSATADGNIGGTTLVSLWDPAVPEGLNEGDDYWNDGQILLLTGEMTNQQREITGFVQATGVITVAPRFVNPVVSLLTVDSPGADVVIDVADASLFPDSGSLLTVDAVLADPTIVVADVSRLRPGAAVISDITGASEAIVILAVVPATNLLVLLAPLGAGYTMANEAAVSMAAAYIWDDAPNAEAVVIIGIDETANQLTIAPPGLVAAYTVLNNAAISMSPTILDDVEFTLMPPTRTVDTGEHTNPRRYEKDYGFTSAPVARVGAVATALWEVALAAVYPAAGRTAGTITTIYELHIENSTGAAVTAWLEDDAGNAITVIYHVATLDTVVIDWPAGFTRGDAEVYINASVNDVVAQIFGTQE